MLTNILILLTDKVNITLIPTDRIPAAKYNMVIESGKVEMAMSKQVSFKNRDRFIQLGVAIATLRRVRGMSQEKLAEKACISRSLVSAIEAPNMANGFSLEAFFNIADALEVDPADLINASVFPDRILKK